jgi:hypothetical protein
MATTRAWRRRSVAVGVLLAAGVAGTFVPPAASAGDKDGLHLPRVGFACCNLRYEGDWISDGNYAVLPMLPAGTPIKVVSRPAQGGCRDRRQEDASRPRLRP